MPVLTVCNHKGGTGKTTSSIHLAAAFGHAGGRVLVIDFDPQGFLTRMLGASEPPPEHSALGLLDASADLASFPVQTVSGFDLIGSSMALTKALRRMTRPTDVLWLRETLQTAHDYDIVLIDTAAALSPFTMNALVASDLVVIPVTPEYQPVVGAEQTWQTCGLVQDKLNPRLSVPRFLLTQVDGRLNRHAKYAEYLRGKYGEAVLETPIRTSSSLAAASRDGRTVFDAGVTTRGAVDYRNAAKEIARHLYAAATAPPADSAAESAPAAPPEAQDVPAPPPPTAQAAPTAPASGSPAPPAERGGDGALNGHRVSGGLPAAPAAPDGGEAPRGGAERPGGVASGSDATP
ncbi:ParA family protein [Rubrivirga litoralis]|uniref:ParA family protein n=1 Tax=Rubrivirga litoralis TaxID=3075598 RepID=A0ABU3BT95_9BACT|nr:ParA family protein [Rubrivirga sp. F394]MDT0632523.1 ParA family protein [Rubrivirga sp. F394]